MNLIHHTICQFSFVFLGKINYVHTYVCTYIGTVCRCDEINYYNHLLSLPVIVNQTINFNETPALLGKFWQFARTETGNTKAAFLK